MKSYFCFRNKLFVNTVIFLVTLLLVTSCAFADESDWNALQILAYLENIDESALDPLTLVDLYRFVSEADFSNITQEDINYVKTLLAGAATLAPTERPSPSPQPTPKQTSIPRQNSYPVSNDAAYDFQSMDDDAFISLWHAAQVEYMRRASHFATLLGAGAYEAGIDVPTGNYTLIPTGRTGAPPGIVIFPNREVYEQQADEKFPKGYLLSVDTWRGERCDIALLEGNILVINDFPVHCFKGSDFSAATDTVLYSPPEGTSVPAGVYVVGQDIPVGQYTFHYNGKNAVLVEMYRDRKLFEGGSYRPTNHEIISLINPQVSFSLPEGYILVIKYNSVIVNKASQLFD